MNSLGCLYGIVLWIGAALGMFGLAVTSAVTPPPMPTVTAAGYIAPPIFSPGETMTIHTAFGKDLNLRAEAGLAFPILERLPDGAQVILVGGPLLADGFRWWQVRTADGVEGWVVDFADGISTLAAADETGTAKE